MTTTRVVPGPAERVHPAAAVGSAADYMVRALLAALPADWIIDRSIVRWGATPPGPLHARGIAVVATATPGAPWHVEGWAPAPGIGAVGPVMRIELGGHGFTAEVAAGIVTALTALGIIPPPTGDIP